jgi:nucleoside transporter
VLGILHLFSGALLFLLSTVGADAGVMFLATLGALLAYMPTIALSNSVALNGIGNAERQFPALRVFGTIGWIVAGLIVGKLLPGEAERTSLPLQLAGGVSILYGLYAFTLPKTPPRAGQSKPSLVTLLGLDAIGKADRSFWTLIVCSMLMMIPFSFYNVYANPYLDSIGMDDPAAIQTIGQVSEVGFLLLLPLFFRWIGIKGVLTLGMIAWAVRYVIFAYGFDASGPIEPMIYAGLALHGVGFDFVFVAATIWVGTHFAAEASSRAQSFLALMTWGVGYLIGSNLANLVQVGTGDGGRPDWQSFWLLPAGFAAVTAVVFLIAFRDRRERPGAAPA